jgi:hypothetical protein
MIWRPFLLVLLLFQRVFLQWPELSQFSLQPKLPQLFLSRSFSAGVSVFSSATGASVVSSAAFSSAGSSAFSSAVGASLATSSVSAVFFSAGASVFSSAAGASVVFSAAFSSAGSSAFSSAAGASSTTSSVVSSAFSATGVSATSSAGASSATSSSAGAAAAFASAANSAFLAAIAASFASLSLVSASSCFLTAALSSPARRSFCLNLGFFFSQPFFQSLFGFLFAESSFFYSTHQVFFVEHTFVRQNCLHGVGRLGAFYKPVVSFVKIEIYRSRIRVRIIRANPFNVPAISWRPAICYHNVVVSITFAAVPR